MVATVHDLLPADACPRCSPAVGSRLMRAGPRAHPRRGGDGDGAQPTSVAEECVRTASTAGACAVVPLGVDPVAGSDGAGWPRRGPPPRPRAGPTCCSSAPPSPARASTCWSAAMARIGPAGRDPGPGRARRAGVTAPGRGWTPRVPGPVRRLGFVPAGDLDLLRRGAAVFCLPSRAEGFGLPGARGHGRRRAGGDHRAAPPWPRSPSGVARLVATRRRRGAGRGPRARCSTTTTWPAGCAGTGPVRAARVLAGQRTASAVARRVRRGAADGERAPAEGAGQPPVAGARRGGRQRGVDDRRPAGAARSTAPTSDLRLAVLGGVRRRAPRPGRRAPAARCSTAAGPTRSAGSLAEQTWLAGGPRRARRRTSCTTPGEWSRCATRAGCVLTIHDLQPLDDARATSRWPSAPTCGPCSAGRRGLREVVCVPTRVHRVAGGRAARGAAGARRGGAVVRGAASTGPRPTPRSRPSLRQRPVPRAGGPFLLYPAITYPHKNHLVLLEAFARAAGVRSPTPAWCSPAGAGPSEPEVRGPHRPGRTSPVGCVRTGPGGPAPRWSRCTARPPRWWCRRATRASACPALEAMSRGCAGGGRRCRVPARGRHGRRTWSAPTM